MPVATDVPAKAAITTEEFTSTVNRTVASVTEVLMQAGDNVRAAAREGPKEKKLSNSCSVIR